MARDDSIVFQHERDQVTVGDLREWHYLEVTCADCGRVGYVYPSTLWKRYPADTRIADLARRFRCCRCWTKGGARWNVLKMDRGVYVMGPAGIAWWLESFFDPKLNMTDAKKPIKRTSTNLL